ncbi:substrate-binding domain-containing protein [Cytobacillus praedii]|uniref:substrate-binding domain-containing protein n=1 Tax=Cytobacillus praedii TaxID=1742358 RepID=UPI003F7DF10A
MDGMSYTTEEVAQILKVSKLTIYDLVKKGLLPTYRVGRQMRIDPADLKEYIQRSKRGEGLSLPKVNEVLEDKPKVQLPGSKSNRQVIISGQDLSLDILANHFEKSSDEFRTLRSYTGSLEGLISMYQGHSDIVSSHLIDGQSGDYNLPYISRILVNFEYIVINLLSRKAGFYVQKGNPKQIKNWIDLKSKDVEMINREKGSGARVLVDEYLKKHKISIHEVKGYGREETNHLSVASAVAKGVADVGVGIEKATNIVQGVDFIPLVNERYDLVLLKTIKNEGLIKKIQEILRSEDFQSDLEALGGYDLSKTGQIIYET